MHLGNVLLHVLKRMVLFSIDPQVAFWLSIAFGILAALALITMLWVYLVGWGRLAFRKTPAFPDATEPISVVICARNEAQNLFRNLPLVFQQDYPTFQVVVVNDCSVDESEDILEEFQKKHPNLHVVNLKEDEIRDHDKKLAITIGIKGARYERMIFTDADCIPAGPQWLRQMASAFQPGIEVVVGYSPYRKTSGFINRLIRYDAFVGAVQYLSAAIGGKPYMAVGRNMGYTKTLFFKNRGFATHYHIQSGDDDLFVNKVARADNTAVVLLPEAFTYTEPKKTFKAWRTQKRRHLSTARYYKSSDKLRLGIHVAAQYAFWLGAVPFACFSVFPFQPWIALGSVLLKWVVQMVVLSQAGKRLQSRDLWIFSPIFELLLMGLFPFWHLANRFVKRHAWK
jgi:cellulose synthase/poly-beta-1,6-N-acetylglucosamine synthase-like glycosyltransferase